MTLKRSLLSDRSIVGYQVQTEIHNFLGRAYNCCPASIRLNGLTQDILCGPDWGRPNECFGCTKIRYKSASAMGQTRVQTILTVLPGQVWLANLTNRLNTIISSFPSPSRISSSMNFSEFDVLKVIRRLSFTVRYLFTAWILNNIIVVPVEITRKILMYLPIVTLQDYVTHVETGQLPMLRNVPYHLLTEEEFKKVQYVLFRYKNTNTGTKQAAKIILDRIHKAMLAVVTGKSLDMFVRDIGAVKFSFYDYKSVFELILNTSIVSSGNIIGQLPAGYIRLSDTRDSLGIRILDSHKLIDLAIENLLLRQFRDDGAYTNFVLSLAEYICCNYEIQNQLQNYCTTGNTRNWADYIAARILDRLIWDNTWIEDLNSVDLGPSTSSVIVSSARYFRIYRTELCPAFLPLSLASALPVLKRNLYDTCYSVVDLFPLSIYDVGHYCSVCVELDSHVLGSEKLLLEGFSEEGYQSWVFLNWLIEYEI